MRTIPVKDLESLQLTIEHALLDHLLELDTEVRNAVWSTVKLSNSKGLKKETQKMIDEGITRGIQSFFRSGEGKDVISKAVVDHLRLALKTGKQS